MYKNYLITVLRSLWKNKAFSAINIFGLAVGLAASLLILLYVQYELSYDSHNQNLDRLYRITIVASLGGSDVEAATSPYPMAATLRNEYPEVESAARFRQFFSETLVSLNELSFQESQVFHADPELLEMFTFNFVAGDPDTALDQPYSLVITETTASKYFGNEPALGRILRFNNSRDYEITGVIEDLPANSHFHPEILVSFTSDEQHDLQLWVMNNINTYVMLREGTDAEVLQDKLQELVAKYVAPQIQEGIGTTYEEFLAGGGYWGYELMPVADIHLHSTLDDEIEPPGSAAYVYTFQAVAMFILLLACINFMNLSTARSANRAREIGIRKVVGALQPQLVTQFLLESVLVSLIALLIALPLVGLLLPMLSAITDREMSMTILLGPLPMTILLGLIALVGVVSGSYPAFFLSRFHPQEVLKGSVSRGGGNLMVRGTLVVFQFAISIALLSATLVVYSQLDYLRSKPLGFEKDQIIVVERAAALGEQLESFKTRLAQHPGVLNISSGAHLPGDGGDQNGFRIEGRPASETFVLNRFTVDYDYPETLGLEIIEGRSFSRDIGAAHAGYLINEAAVRELALENPLQTTLLEPNNDTLESGSVIGVVRDFHFMSLHQPIMPMVLRVNDFTRYVLIRTQGEQTVSVIAALENTWEEMTGGEPFSYHFLGAEFDALHAGEEKVGELFISFSVLAIIIACLGLYGLASFATEQRSKEIGIRKTLGASVIGIVLMVSREFVLLVIIAMVIAAPLAYLGMSQWLSLFAYRIDFNPVVLVVSGLVATLIAFFTVGLQSYKAANTNPVLTLRDE